MQPSVRRFYCIVLLLFVSASVATAPAEPRKRTMARVVSSGGPFSTTIHLFDDGSFTILSQGNGPGPGAANPFTEGTLPPPELERLSSWIAACGILDATIDQKDDPSMVMEGGLTAKVRNQERTVVLEMPCVGSYEPKTNRAIELMRNLFKKLQDTLGPFARPARKGVYVEALNLGDVARVVREHKQYYNQDLTLRHDIDTLEKPFKAAAAYGCLVYLGLSASDPQKALHRKHFEKKSTAFLFLLHLFDGTSVESFDTVLKSP